jgi:pyrroloquinoline quinone (PQQ) biosynthesis protein C
MLKFGEMENSMLEQYKLHTSCTQDSSLVANLRLAELVQKNFSKQIEIENVAPLQFDEYPGIKGKVDALIYGGFNENDQESLNDLHATLFLLYEETLKPVALANDLQFHLGLMWLRNKIEKPWILFELNNLSRIPENLSTDSSGFEAKFNQLWKSHRYMTHPFHDYVKKQASLSQLKELFTTESVCASRFADMVALTLPGIPRIDSVVSEVMENLTDELGPKDGLSHKKLFAQLLSFLKIPIPSHPLDALLPYGWKAVRGLNLFMYNALHRKNYYRMMGALGAGELTFPFFCNNVLDGAKRNNILNEQALVYYAQHSTLDIQHGENWLKRVLIPLLEMSPSVGDEILLGLELQLTVTSEYYDVLYEYWQKQNIGN